MLEDVVALLPMAARAGHLPLQRFFAAGTSALAALDQLDLSAFDETPPGETAAEAWAQVGALAEEPLAVLTGLRAALDEPCLAALARQDDPRLGKPRQLIERLLEGIELEVTKFREEIGRVQSNNDRWSMLLTICTARGRLHAAIGECIYDVARQFAPVTRDGVIFNYRSALDAALALRDALGKLGGEVRRIVAMLKGDPQADIAEPLAAALTTLSVSPAYVFMRPRDRKFFLDARHALRAGGERTVAGAVLEEMSAFFEAFPINARETLVRHDQGVLGEAATRLDNADELLRTAVLRARIEALSALSMIEAVSNARPESEAQAKQLRQEIQRLESLLESAAPMARLAGELRTVG